MNSIYGVYFSIIYLSIILLRYVEAYSPLRFTVPFVRAPSHLCASEIEAILNMDQFDSVTKNCPQPSGVQIIDFQKSQCKPCIKVAPAYEALAVKYESKAKFYKVDADSSKDALAVLKANGIRSVPTFHVWKNGAFVDSVQGAHVDELEEMINNNL